jgi:hypothetical protein
MRRRRFVQTLTALPVAPALVAQQVSTRSPVSEELPKLSEFSVPDIAAEPVPHFFSTPQFEALQRLSDLVLPKIGDTPGALEARAPAFLDFLLSVSPANRRQLYRAGLDSLNEHARVRFGKSFAQLDAAQADQILAPLHERWMNAPPTASLPAFLRAAKADILTATVNSREWIEVVSKRSRGAAGTGLYWHAIA